MEPLRRPPPMQQVLDGGGLEIRDSAYTLTVKALPRSTRGRRVVRVDVDVRLGWPRPLRLEFHLPDDTDDLRDMLERLQGESFAEWLESNGYDRYGNCLGRRCKYGNIINE